MDLDKFNLDKFNLDLIYIKPVCTAAGFQQLEGDLPESEVGPAAFITLNPDHRLLVWTHLKTESEWNIRMHAKKVMRKVLPLQSTMEGASSNPLA